MNPQQHTTPDVRLGDRARGWSTVALVAGLVGVAAAFFLSTSRGDHGSRLQHAWLVSAMFFVSISVGALFFVVVQHLTRAGWSVVVRRVAELLAANVAIGALLLVPILIQVLRGDASLYPWVDHDAAAHDPLLAKKAVVLNGAFFAARCVVYLGTWILLSRWLLRRSVEQDGARDAAPTLALERRAAPAMIAFALTTCLAAFDLLMTLSPKWYSTIFGVYFFAGSVISFFATTILVLRFLQARGILRGTVGVEHYHDLGKFLFAFVFFWGYIAFSQFMLIWYADLPEETFWYRDRLAGTWTQVSYVLLFGHFVLPFAGLLSRHAKRNLGVLTFWAAWMLVMHALDLYWLVFPKIQPFGASITALDVAAFVGAGGLWAFGLLRTATRHSLVPIHDPRLHESMAFENL